jgi:hypothetical protein
MSATYEERDSRLLSVHGIILTMLLEYVFQALKHKIYSNLKEETNKKPQKTMHAPLISSVVLVFPVVPVVPVFPIAPLVPGVVPVVLAILSVGPAIHPSPLSP